MFTKFTNLSHASYHPQVPASNDAYQTIGEISLIYETNSPLSVNLLAASNTTGGIINTIDDYLHLDLNPNDTNFWSPKLDRQYQQAISQSQFPLKVYRS